MRRELGKAVRKRFEARLKREAPQFLPATTQEVPAGCRGFVWPIAPDLSAFLLLVISRENRFTVEGALSRDGRFPGQSLPISPEDCMVNLNVHGICRFRIAGLWRPRGIDPWWEVIPRPSSSELDDRLDRIVRGEDEYSSIEIEKALQRVEPLVDDAVQRTVSVVVPFFARVARSLGVSMRDDGSPPSAGSEGGGLR